MLVNPDYGLSPQNLLELNKLKERDSYTARHCEDLATWAGVLARRLGCNEIEVKNIRYAALYHDIGKIGVPDEILQKPGALTDEEWQIMRSHSEIGANMVLAMRGMENVAPLILAHHERFDGCGYPHQLSGTDIPLGSRIIAVLDAYFAMIDDRAYKDSLSHEVAISELRRYSGIQFDPRVVEAFLMFSSHLKSWRWR